MVSSHVRSWVLGLPRICKESSVEMGESVGVSEGGWAETFLKSTIISSVF